MQAYSPDFRRPRGFTLIELLVTVAIIALLISILLPSLARVRSQAKSSVCLSNLKQIGTGLVMYLGQNRDFYPQHSSVVPAAPPPPKTRWPDALRHYMQNTEIYRCPTLTDEQKKLFMLPFAHTLDRTTWQVTTQTKFHGGYGYNFQYLGNARYFGNPPLTGAMQAWMPSDYNKPYFAPLKSVRMPSMTVAIGDVRGSKKGLATNVFGVGGAATYSMDPPLGGRDLGSKGSRKSASGFSDYYEGSGDEELWRSAPDQRHEGRPNIAFTDGHAERIDGDTLDGKKNGEPGDNRYFNGRFDSRLR